MGAEARERLRRLCADGGWSYAVLWRAVEGGGVRHLVWEEGHCEASTVSSLSHAHQVGDLEFNRDDVVGAFVEKMKSEVHVVGYGLVGCAALTGNHRWINHNANPGEVYASAGCLEINDHLRSGIQTAVVIPVLPRGVVQLGSMHMIVEDIGFVNHVRCLVSQLQCLPVEPMSDNASNGSHQNLRNKFEQLTRKTGNHQSIKLPSSRCSSQPSCSYALEIDEAGILIGGGMPSIFNTAITTSSNSIAESQPLKNIIINGSMVSLSGQRQAQHMENYVSPDLCILAKQQMVPQGIKPENKIMPLLIGSRLSHSFDYKEQLSGTVLGNSTNNGSNLDGSGQLRLDSYGYSEGLYSQSSIAMPSIGTGELHERSCAAGEVALPIGKQQTMAVNDMDVMGPSIFARIPCSANFSTNRYALIGDPSAHATSSTDIYFMKTTVSGHHHTQGEVSQNLCSKSLEHCYASCSKDMSPGECLEASKLDHRFKEQQHGAPRQNNLCFTTGRQGAHVSSSIPMIAESASDTLNMQKSGNDLFDVLGAYARSSSGSLNCLFGNVDTTEAWRSCTDSSCCISQADTNPKFDSSVCGTSSEALLDASHDQLLDAVVSKVALGARDTSTDDVMSRTVRSEAGCSFNGKPSGYCQLSMSGKLHPGFAVSPSLVENGLACSSVKSSCSLAETSDYYGDNAYKTDVSLWTESDQNKHRDNASLAQIMKADEMGKLNRKRSKPGESPRPRPKDRQMIQDRVKELREIVPNGAKLSIDALLERTIKHMLFLQSVTKHADKLKEIGEPKIISKEGGLLLKDNFEGGATWAFEVGTQTMICPIIVEDLNPPRQLLVEMLCEERGFFLEIADLIRGLGLTILKGVMEARSDKIWARFAVEANRDITRMDIFLSLVQLLEPRTVSSAPQQGFDSTNMATNISDSDTSHWC